MRPPSQGGALITHIRQQPSGVGHGRYLSMQAYRNMRGRLHVLHSPSKRSLKTHHLCVWTRERSMQGIIAPYLQALFWQSRACVRAVCLPIFHNDGRTILPACTQEPMFPCRNMYLPAGSHLGTVLRIQWHQRRHCMAFHAASRASLGWRGGERSPVGCVPVRPSPDAAVCAIGVSRSIFPVPRPIFPTQKDEYIRRRCLNAVPLAHLGGKAQGGFPALVEAASASENAVREVVAIHSVRTIRQLPQFLGGQGVIHRASPWGWRCWRGRQEFLAFRWPCLRVCLPHPTALPCGSCPA